MIITKCGKHRSKRGKLFTEKSLKQHQNDCRVCSGHYDIGERPFPLTDMIADDSWPDGAYFALAWELGEL